MKEATVSFPIRLPASVRDELKALAEECAVSDQDIMRLALRIGLIDLRSTGNDLASLVKESADELGLSFAAFAKRANKTNAFLTGTQPLLVPQSEEPVESPPIKESTIKAAGKTLKFYSPPVDKESRVAEDPPSGTTAGPFRAAAKQFLSESSASSPPPAQGSPAPPPHPRFRWPQPPARGGK